jgi:adenylosuccinate synthase
MASERGSLGSDAFHSQLEYCTPEYKEFPGWQKPTTKAKTWFDLPAKARAYVEFVEEFVGVKVNSVSSLLHVTDN